ncbi:MAG: AAA family ATPase [Steroidobacteraceae bacterium]|nr:AAA family ATPase [Steroidobacteraceae bacterium]
MLSSLEVENFRCIEQARLSFDARATGIVGPNASGKTSLLEAIYFLGHGRSFRAAQRDKLIRHDAPFLRIVGRLDAASDPHVNPPPPDGGPSDGASALPHADSGASPTFAGRAEAAGELGDPRSARDRSGASAGAAVDSAPGAAWDAGRSSAQVVAGVEYQPDRLQVRLGGKAVSGFSEIAAVLPIQVIDPGVHRLIEEGSARRRKLLDWGVFHVKHDFLLAWRRYQRALQQRNAALRSGAGLSMVTVWDTELSSAAQLLDHYREGYLAVFMDTFRRWAGRLVSPAADLQYRRGWRAGVTLEEALAENQSRDQRLRTTTVGPHRADLQFTMGGAAARDQISRGQQKMLASAFVLSQVALRAESDAPPTCLLLDDPAAELDVDNLGKLLEAITEIPAQLVVTAVHEGGLRGLPVGRMFHVERGKVRPMV